MKTKKLSINKEVIARLDNSEMNAQKGGTILTMYPWGCDTSDTMCICTASVPEQTNVEACKQ